MTEREKRETEMRLEEKRSDGPFICIHHLHDASSNAPFSWCRLFWAQNRKSSLNILTFMFWQSNFWNTYFWSKQGGGEWEKTLFWYQESFDGFVRVNVCVCIINWIDFEHYLHKLKLKFVTSIRRSAHHWYTTAREVYFYIFLKNSFESNGVYLLNTFLRNSFAVAISRPKKTTKKFMHSYIKIFRHQVAHAPQ